MSEDAARGGLGHWLESRAGQWQRLAESLRTQKDSRNEDPAAVLGLLQGFRALARDLSLARGILPRGRVTRYLEALFAQAHEAVYREPRNFRAGLKLLWREEVPDVVRDMRGPILATGALFLFSLLLGWLLVRHNPDLAGLFASREMIESVRGGELWTDDLLNIMPSSLLAFSIIANNITVSLFAFVLGAFYGIGTLYIIALNGLMLGGIFAFTRQYGLDGRLFEFVIAHGVVELSVICLAGAAGVSLGEALIRPGMRSRAEAFRQAVARAGKLLGVALPFLAGAGLIEGYLSPDLGVPLPVKLFVGIAYGLLFWLTLTGRAWRRPPA